MLPSALSFAAALLQLSSVVAAHGNDGSHSMDMDIDMAGISMSNASAQSMSFEDYYLLPSYAGLLEHSSWMLTHIVLMVAAWLFVLPIGVIFSISRSKLALPAQLLFLLLNGVGIVLGTMYNVKTPDLYENNVHHKIGWIATWILTVQAIMSLIFLYSGRTKPPHTTPSERAAFLPVSVEVMAQHNMPPYSDHRWSGDSGQGTERSSMHNSRDVSPTDSSRCGGNDSYPKSEGNSDEEDEPLFEMPHRYGVLRNDFKFLARCSPGMFTVPKGLLQAFEITYNIIDRTILLLGFTALITGGATYAGLFRGSHIFNGLAHFIKGGIFFWYGLLTLGRWMGCFAEFGWAWNVRPTRSEVDQWKASVPSAEFVESFVIWLYGATNVFLEHLTAWGDAWSAQDLEHVSISIMFFGGGMCGMLVESTTIRKWLNTTIESLPMPRDMQHADAQELRSTPKTYGQSMNVMPGLIILLLGIMMSSHHQDSMVSTMVHAQWGTLLCGFSLARGVTYIITYISPPTSCYASRPPSELVSSFCLISGGLVFMLSTQDIIHLLEVNDLHAMFPFTVMMGFTAFLMAWEIVVLALRGWTIRREMRAGQ